MKLYTTIKYPDYRSELEVMFVRLICGRRIRSKFGELVIIRGFWALKHQLRVQLEEC